MTTNTEALHYLIDAIDGLQKAKTLTQNGFAVDHCVNALNEIKKALTLENAYED